MTSPRPLPFGDFLAENALPGTIRRTGYEGSGAYRATHEFGKRDAFPTELSGARVGGRHRGMCWGRLESLTVGAQGLMMKGGDVLCGDDVAGFTDPDAKSPRLHNRTLAEYLRDSAPNGAGRDRSPGADRRLERPCLVLVRPGDHIYGHWLIDLLPQIRLVCRTMDAGELDVLISDRVPAYAEAWLRKLGFGEIHRLRTREDILLLDEAVLCSPTRLHHDFFCGFEDFAPWFFDALGIEPEPVHEDLERVFLSRVNLPNRTRALINRAEIEASFRAHGFTVLHPETLSAGQQRHVFANTRCIAGEFGSALHNSLFCSPDTGVVSVQSSKNGNLIQSTLCGQLGQSNYVVFGQAEGQDYTADFTVDPGLIDIALERVLGTSSFPVDRPVALVGAAGAR